MLDIVAMLSTARGVRHAKPRRQSFCRFFSILSFSIPASVTFHPPSIHRASKDPSLLIASMPSSPSVTSARRPHLRVNERSDERLATSFELRVRWIPQDEIPKARELCKTAWFGTAMARWRPDEIDIGGLELGTMPQVNRSKGLEGGGLGDEGPSVSGLYLARPIALTRCRGTQA